MTVIERFAGYLVDLRLDRLADDERAVLVDHVIDTVGASVAGAHSTEGRAVLAFNPGRTLTGAKRPGAADPLDALAWRVAATRSTEIDDIHMGSCTTPGAIVIPTALTVAAGRASVTGAELGAAILAGYEAMTRLGRAIGGAAIVYRGVWPTYFGAPFAAAAVVGRLIGLRPEAMAHALATALSMAAGGAGRPRGGIGARWLLAGNAARSGALAALAAAEGFTGDTGLLDGDWLETVHGLAADVAPLADAAADPTVLRALSLKPYCSAKQAVAAIHGFSTIIAGGIEPHSIREVRVSVPRAYAAMIDHGVVAGARLSSLTSAPYQLALAGLRPDGLDDVSRDRFIADAPVAALMKTVRVEIDDALAAHLPDRYPARVRVTTGSDTREVLVLDAPGDPGARFDRPAVIAKFRRFTDGQIPAATQDDLTDAAACAFDTADGPARLAGLYAGIFARRRGKS